ncbi:MAG: DinB family protein [Thermoanaerobaculia bacterium]|nr:DinB family protein [Thermoanaerobaculia bacterium]
MEIREIGPFLHYWKRIRKRTLRVAEQIPAERLEWGYDKSKFTFGDILRHLAAIERWMFAENVQGNPSRYPGHGRELADGRDEVFDYLERMHREALSIFGELGPEDLQRPCETPGGAELRTWKWLRAMVEHEVHHRGQLYVYLGTLGISTPPLYGLTSEEVRDRSLEPG